MNRESGQVHTFCIILDKDTETAQTTVGPPTVEASLLFHGGGGCLGERILELPVLAAPDLCFGPSLCLGEDVHSMLGLPLGDVVRIPQAVCDADIFAATHQGIRFHSLLSSREPNFLKVLLLPAGLGHEPAKAVQGVLSAQNTVVEGVLALWHESPTWQQEREREKENYDEKPREKKKSTSLTSRPKGIEHNATILDLRKVHDAIYK